jgi:hypothetical protein
VKSITSCPPSTMSTPRIAKLITRITVRPVPLFQDDVDSMDSHDDNAAAIEETLAMQGPKASGKVENLATSFGLMDPAGYVDMREPWVEGSRSEKVSLSRIDFCITSLTLGSIFGCR